MGNAFLIYYIFAKIIALSNQTVLLGIWEKDSFEKNDLYIDRSRSLSVKQIFAHYYENKNEKDLFDYPLEIYRKIVNGFRYKLFFVVNDKSTDEIKFYTTIVNSGPFSERKPTFIIDQVEVMKPENKITNNKSTLSKIQKALDNFFNLNNTEVTVVSQYTLPEISSSMFYLIKTQTNQQYVLFEDKETIYAKFELR